MRIFCTRQYVFRCRVLPYTTQHRQSRLMGKQNSKFDHLVGFFPIRLFDTPEIEQSGKGNYRFFLMMRGPISRHFLNEFHESRRAELKTNKFYRSRDIKKIYSNHTCYKKVYFSSRIPGLEYGFLILNTNKAGEKTQRTKGQKVQTKIRSQSTGTVL